MIEVEVLKDINEERERQDEEWGEQNHSPVIWMPILMEEVGEAAQEAVKSHFADEGVYGKHVDLYRQEMIQVAALAIAMIESLDRQRDAY